MIRLLFLQAHRETDRFFSASGVQFPEHGRGLFPFRRVGFSSEFKEKVGSTLAKAADFRVNLNIDGAPITSRTHTHPSHSETSVMGEYVLLFSSVMGEYVLLK